MFRKRRRPTPYFKIPPPYNPIAGEYANLNPQGVYPFCAMMQIAAEDTYNDYVICRGFDIRTLKFIDYEAGNEDKPGISVAKPFGSRGNKTYNIGEVYPAFLPAQGTLTYVPPVPEAVKWRIGQNPGVLDPVVVSDDGHPASLSDEIQLLQDHNDELVNWMLIDTGGGTGGSGGGAAAFIVLTDEDGIPAMTDTTPPFDFPFGTCVKVNSETGVVSTEEIIVFNMTQLPIAGNTLIQIKRMSDSGRYFVDVDGCTNEV